MADIAGSYSSNQSYNPKFNYSISYSQTGRSGSAVSYRFNVSFSKQNGWYGYDININWNIGGATGSRQIKSTADVSSGSTSFDVTCSTNASGGTLAAQIWTSSSADGTHWQNKMDTGSRTVNKSTFNTPPSLDGGVTADGTTENKIISENKPSILVSWPAGSDTNNNLSGYRLRVSINGGGYAELTRTSSRSYTHNVSGYGEGSTFRYAVDAYDSYGEWSKTIYSGTITKNIFTPSSFNSSSKISYSDGNSTIVFNVSGGGNTDGSGISRSISCDGLTVYNGNAVEETTTVTVYRTGGTPTGPYVRFDDIKNKFASTNYNNSLNFRLTTINNYGNSKYNIKNIGVDLRTNPNPVASCSISTTDSTAYETVSSTGNKYFIPDSGKYITVIWETATGKLGEPITYDLYVSYGGGAWQLVTELLSQESTKYNHYVPKQNASQSIRYKVRTKTLYGYYSDKDTSLETLHYYNSPSLSQGTITRGATTADVIVTIKSNSSIPNINTVGTWNCYDKGTSVSVSNGTLTVSQNAQTLKITGLTDAGQYDLKVTFKDDTGFSNNNIITIAIGANSPIFFVNKYGAGVGGIKATSTYSLNVSGDSSFSGSIKASSVGIGVNPDSNYSLNVKGNSNFDGNIKANDVFASGSGKQVRFHIPNDSYAWISTDATAGLFSNQNIYVRGEVFVGSQYNNQVYHSGNKPNLKDLNRTLEPGQEINWNVYGDGAKIYAEQTSDNSTSLCLEVADDGDSDTVKIRNNHYKDGNKDVAVFRRTYVGIYADLAAPKYAFNSGTASYITGRSGDGGFDFWCRDNVRFCFDGTNMKLYKVVNGVWTVIAG